MCVAGAPAALRILFRVTENIEANEEFIFNLPIKSLLIKYWVITNIESLLVKYWVIIEMLSLHLLRFGDITN